MNGTAEPSAVKRVIGNTLILYFRMFVVTCVSIFSFRLLTTNLHIEGYGVFTAVSGLVLFFGFFNAAVINAVQRFLNIELGKNIPENTAKVFSCSLLLFFVLVLVIIVLGETAGLYYLHHKLVYPPAFRRSIDAVYQLLLLASCIRLLQQPFYLLVVANERMGVLALVSLLEALLNLGLVSLLFFFGNRVVVYSLGTAVIAFIVLVCYGAYCKLRHPEICSLSVSRPDRAFLKSMSSFSGWSLLSSIATGTAQQGQNLILNSFGGILVTAAFGVSVQISNMANTFLANFQTALIPFLMKTYVRMEQEKSAELVCRASKYSLFLLSFVVVPIIVNTGMVLKILAPETSEFTSFFVRLAMFQLLLNSLSCPLYTQIQSTGDIRLYQILVSIVLIAQLPLCYILLKAGLPFYSVYIGCTVLDGLALAVRLYCLKRNSAFPVLRFCGVVLLRTAAVFAVLGLLLGIIDFSAADIFGFLWKSLLLDILLLCVILGVGVSAFERRVLLGMFFTERNAET